MSQRTSITLIGTAIFGALLVTSTANAQTTTVIDEQYKQIKAPGAISKLGADLFGDRVNLYNGSLEFTQTDISIPGNSALPVEIGRRFTTGNRGLGSRAFGRWDIEIPHIHGIFSQTAGWKAGVGSGARCTDFGPPPDAAGARNESVWSAEDFWNGSFLYVPGRGDQQMLGRAPGFTLAPGPVSAYPVVTTALWSVSCLPSLANDTSANHSMGEGFVAVSPEGVSYRFDWMASFPALALTRPSETGLPRPDSLLRKEVWILPTQVSDRFGNWVRYTYDPASPTHLTRIDASDARTITLTYDSTATTGHVQTVSDGTRTWTYAYNATDLASITLPDGSAWQFGNSDSVNNSASVSQVQSCDSPSGISSDLRSYTMVHPSGATGTFNLRGTVHGRSGIPKTCDSASGWAQRPALYFYTESLSSKTISGPGLAAMTWNYNYGTPVASYAPCDSGCAKSKTVSVTEPDGVVKTYTFGNHYKNSEGRLEQSSIGGLQTTTTRYRAFGAGPYPTQFGYNYGGGSEGDSDMSIYLAPVDQKITSQDGVDFIWEADPYSFDALGRPTVVNKYSSLGYRRVERTDYVDNYPLWVLGKTGKVTETQTGKVIVQNTYESATANLKSVARFGRPDASFTYYGDGTLATQKDGLLQTTTYSNYKRGIPQSISFADSTTQSAVVNNIGKITSLTNEVATTTGLGYDAMGRLASITYPQETGLAYNPTTITVAQVNAWEYDLPPGHWRQVVTTGNAVEANYYDALWRPIYTERYDSTDAVGTIRLTKHQYDFAGHTTYESYPKSAGLDVTSEGTYSQYDALGRSTITTRVSELGNLTESFTYDSGFQKTHNDAKGHSSTYAYQAFDEPNDGAITTISMAEGVSMYIARDLFGKTSFISRSGNGVSATRRYVYDGYERLCKTIEPETGATIQNYDDANNVSWRASGLALPDTSTCNTGNVPAAKMISYTYDARNRLRNTTYGDSSPAIYRTYTDDGLPSTIQSDGTLWSYGYNNRRLLTSETLNYGGVNYALGRTYDANGTLSQLTYPGNFTVAYNPNALGEQRQAGSYATGVIYHANGAVKQFSYGNGIVHTLSQNVRGLPQVSQDGTVLKDSYAYDQSGNVASITDQAEGITTRGMEYDGLDRLKHVNAPALWGDAWYGYDALDNIISSQITAGAKARTLTHNINYSTNRLDSLTGSYSLAYQYDSQGNIIQRGAQSYTFDIGNRLRGAPGVTTHVYDGQGRRVSVVGTDGVNHIYLYGQEGKLLYETTTAQAQSLGTKYIYLNRHVVAEVSGSGTVYDHTDGLGSPVAKTNSSAGLISRTRYEPYGATAAGAEPTIGFTGHLNAANLGLVDMQQRFYDPVAGRFLSIDPVTTDANNGSSFNRYNYANNNPYRFVDPDGRNPGDPFKTLALAAKDAINFVNPKSIKENVEYGGILYKGTDGNYRSTQPTTEGSGNGISTAATIPSDAKFVGDFHTHGDYSKTVNGEVVRTSNKATDTFDSDNFSSNDLVTIAATAEGKTEYKGYLGTPSGEVREYDPKTKEDKLVE